MTGLDGLGGLGFLHDTGLLDPLLEKIGLPTVRGGEAHGASATAGAAATESAPPPLPAGLEDLARTLATEPRTSRAYKKAIDEWPADVPIWDHLPTTASRRTFAEHVLLSVDDTDKRPYQSFENLCKGFATQVFMRLSSAAPPADAGGLRQRLGAIGIDAGSYPDKLKMPISLVNRPGHEFNAVLLDEDRPGSMDSYLFYDATGGDHIVGPGHQLWDFYAAKGVMSLVDFVDAVPMPKYPGSYALKDEPKGAWVRDGEGVFRRTSSQRVAEAAPRFFVADPQLNTADGRTEHWTRENYKGALGAKTFAAYVREGIKPPAGSPARPLTDNEIVELGKLLVGRRFRESPDAAWESMTPARFADLVGRPDLRGRIG